MLFFHLFALALHLSLKEKMSIMTPSVVTSQTQCDGVHIYLHCILMNCWLQPGNKAVQERQAIMHGLKGTY